MSDAAERFTWPALGARLGGILGRAVARAAVPEVLPGR
jgi:hypothetical protein